MTELESPIERRRTEIEKNEQERRTIVDPDLVETMKLRYLARIADALETLASKGEPRR